jgi:colanic acid/amylovoran biosynthesis glycosyltransferase
MNKDTQSPIRVAILVRMFPNIVQTYVLNHILSLKDAGTETFILAEDDPKQDEIHPGVSQNNLISETLYISTEVDKIVKQLFMTPVTSPRYLSALMRIIFSGIWKRHGLKYGIKAMIRAKVLSRGNFDIVHSHSLFSSYDYLFLKDTFSIPIATTFHGLVPKNVQMLETKKIEAVLEAGEAFFVNTEFALKQLSDFGCNRNKIHIIPQGTNISDFPFKSRKITSDEPINILSVGRLSIEKGFHIAIRAIKKIITEYPNIKYRIIGGGIEEHNLIELIDELDLRDTVEIVGSVSTDKLLTYYTGAHVFILPSIDFRDGTHTETQGVVLQEAQSSGIPIIASRTGGIPEVIKEGETGLLFEEEDETQLSQHLKMLLDDDAFYQKLCTQARKDVEENYSNEIIYSRMIEIYKQVIQSDSQCG